MAVAKAGLEWSGQRRRGRVEAEDWSRVTRVRRQAEQTSQSVGRSVEFGVTQKSTQEAGAASNASGVRETGADRLCSQ